MKKKKKILKIFKYPSDNIRGVDFCKVLIWNFLNLQHVFHFYYYINVARITFIFYL